MPRLPLELELGLPLTNPQTHTEYTRTARVILQHAKEIAQDHLSEVRSKQHNHSHTTQTAHWQPYVISQKVWLKRPKKWKFGPNWLGPYTVLSRLGVNYRIRSEAGRTLVVHHDHLKPYLMPTGKGSIVSPGQESGDFDVVPDLPPEPNDTPPGLDVGPQVRPAHLRQCIRPPVCYSYVP